MAPDELPMMSRWLLALALAVPSAGCSILIDTDPYQRARDASIVGDATTDGGSNVDPEMPTTPVVRIVPERPLTDDDLVAEIVTESVDPLDAGPVTYLFEWRRDGEPTGLTDSRVPASMTSKGEGWVVNVRAVSADGERASFPVSVGVSIGNTPPRATYIGLADYRPIAGGVIETLRGPVLDPDGDATQLAFTWLRDGTPIEGETGPNLTLRSIPPGSRISVRVTPRDTDDAEGPPLETGEAIVVEDVVRWRQLAPDRYLRRGGFIIYDAPNRRAVLIYELGEVAPSELRMWEYALDGGGNRWVELHPTGDALPSALSRVIVDERNRRVLFFEGSAPAAPSNRVIALDLSTRGGERATQLLPSGDAPAPRAWASMGYDAERQQVILYGGAGGTGSALHDLYLLDVSRPGFETWRRVEHPTTVSLLGAVVLVDEARDRALFVGGVAFTADAPPAVVDTIYSLDLTRPEDGLVLMSSTLPAPLFMGMGMIDAERDRALVGFGGRTVSDDLSQAMYTIDLETLKVEEAPLTGTLPAGGFSGSMMLDPYEPGRVIVYPGPPGTDGDAGRPRFDLYAMRLDTFEMVPIHRYDVDAPPALRDAVATTDFEGAWIFGGRGDGIEPMDTLWRLDVVNGWSRRMPAPDPVTSRAPEARYDVVGSSMSSLAFVGGSGRVSHVPAVAWTLTSENSESNGTWREHVVSAGAPGPSARRGGVVFDPRCSGQELAVFGGVTEGADTASTWALDCHPNDPTSCTWVEIETGSIEARANATIVHGSVEGVLLFGGYGLTTARHLNELWSLDPCAPTPVWTAVTASGTAPSGRHRHTMSHHPVAASVDVWRWLLFGGNTGGLSGVPESNEVWVLERSGSSYRWEPVSVAAGPNDAVIEPRAGHVAVTDERHRRLLVYGGQTANFVRSDLWELRFPAD